MPCSKSCGGGHKKRNVTCAQMEIAPVLTPAPGKCDSTTKPVTHHACNMHPCHNHWHSGQWSQVS